MNLDPEQERKRDEILEELLSLPLLERRAFLDAACGDDAALRSALEELSEVNQRMKTAFLEDGAATFLMPRAGQKIGRYEIGELIGKGGMSRVYRAHDPQIDRTVALKILTGTTDGSATERFLREVRLLGKIRHDNIVQVFDYDEFQGMPFLVMEYLRGEDLSKAIADGRCGDFAQRTEMAIQLATALEYIHAAGIVHRDIKPANVFVEPTGRIKLMDFGIARSSNSGLTHAGMVIGTPAFMSPEQCKGGTVGIASDVFSFGLLLFQLFSGEQPFEGTTYQILYKVPNEPVPLEKLEKASVPAALIDLIRSCTEKAPDKRPANFAIVLEDLRRAKSGGQGDFWRNVSKRRMPIAAAAVVMLGVSIFAMRNRPQAAPSNPPNVQDVVSKQPTPEAPKPTPTPVDESNQIEQRTEEKGQPSVTQQVKRPVRTPDLGLFKKKPEPPSEVVAPSLDLSSNGGNAGANVPSILSTSPLVGAAPQRADPESYWKEIQEVLHQYERAIAAKDLAKLLELRPNLEPSQRRNIQNSFETTRSPTLKFVCEGKPRFATDHARIEADCRQVSQGIGRDRQKLDTSPARTMLFERRGGRWTIVSM